MALPLAPWEEQTQEQPPMAPWEEPTKPATKKPVAAAPPPAPWEQPSPGLGEYASEAGMAVVRGAAATAGSTMRGYGALGPQLAQEEIARAKTINEPLPEDATPEERAAYRTRRAVQHPSPETVQERIDVLQPTADRPIRDTALYRAGQAVESAAGKSKNILNPVVEDVLGGLGSVGTNIATAVIPGAGIPLAITSALGQGAGEAADTALQKGQSDATVAKAANWGLLPGATEFADAALPLLGTPGKVAKVIGKVGARVLEGLAVEGGQEGTQQFIQNLIEKGIYNPQKNIWDDVAYNAFIGGVVGGGVTGVFGGRGHGAEASTPATAEDIAKTQHTITGGDDSANQLNLNLGQPNVQTATLHIRSGKTATDAPAVESPTPPAPPITPDQPMGYRPGEPIPGPDGGMGPDSVAPGNAPQAVGVPTEVDQGVPTEYIPGMQGPQINPLTGQPALPSLQENNPPGGVPQVFAGQKTIPQTDLGVRSTLEESIAANENPDQTLTSSVRNAPRAIAGEIAAEPNPVLQHRMLSDYQAAEHVRLVGDFQEATHNLNLMDPTEGAIPGEEVPQGDRDFAIDTAVVPQNIVQRMPPSLGSGLFEGAATEFGHPYIINSLHTATVSDWLKDIHPDPAQGEVHGLVHRLVSDRLQQVVPDVQVHILSEDEFNRVNPNNPGALAVYFTPTMRDKTPGSPTWGQVMPSTRHSPFIMINERIVDNPRSMSHVVLHETTHAATARTIKSNPKIDSQIRSMMDEVLGRLSDQVYNRVNYAFTNTQEFIAEAFSNPRLQHILANMPVSSQLRKTLELKPKMTMWQAFAKQVQRLLGLQDQTFTMLEAALRIGDRIIDVQANLPGSQARPAQASYVMGIQGNRDAIRSEDPTADPLSAVGHQPEMQGTRDALRRLWPEKLPPAVPHYLGHADRMNWGYKWMAGLDQLARANPRFVPVLRYVERVMKMHLEETEIQDLAVRIGKDWFHLGERGDRLSGFIDDMAHMRYRSDLEVQRGVVRHPSTAETNALVKQYKMDQEMLTLFQRITVAITGDIQQGGTKIGFIGRMAQSAIDRVNERLADPVNPITLKEAQSRIDSIQKNLAQLRRRPYYPFTYFGDHYIIVRDTAGKLVHFETVERRGPVPAKVFQNTRARQLVRQWKKDNPGQTPQMGKDIVLGVLPQHVAPFIGMPSLLLKEVGATMELTSTQINVAGYLAMADAAGQVPILGSRYQKQYYVPGYGLDAKGYSYDMRRSFARFFFHGSKYYVKTKYLTGLRALVKDARTYPGRKENEIGKYMEDHLFNTVIDAKGDWGVLKGGITLWSMGFSPAAASQNLSQLPMITGPFLGAKFGSARATKAILKAMGQVRSTYRGAKALEQYTDLEMRALSYGIKTGRITETQAPEIAGMAQSSLLDGVGGNRVSREWQRWTQRSMKMFEMAEQVNRRVTFRAALNLALQNPKAKYIEKAIAFHQDEYNKLLAEGTPEAEARAIITASDVVEQTQYVYARWARPRFMRGRWPGTLLVFKKYIQSTLFMLGQNPDVLWRYALIATLLGGVEGLPFAEDFINILNLIGKYKFGNAFNLEVELRKHINDLTNGTIDPDLILHGFSKFGFGVPALLDLIGSFATGEPGRGLAAPRHVKDPETGQLRPEGFAKNVPFPMLDRSRAISMGQVLPIDPSKIFAPSNDLNKNIAQQAQQASGAVFSVGFNMYRAAFDNNLPASDWKRWERAMPRIAGDLSQAWRTYSEGRERVHGGPEGGTTVLTYDTRDIEQMMEILAIAAGYNTTRAQKKWDYTMMENEAEQGWALDRKGLLNQLNEAISGGRKEEIDKVRQAIIKFNQELPDRLKSQGITSEGAEKSITVRQTDRAKRELGIPLQNQNIPLSQDMQKLFPDTTFDVRKR